MNNVECPCSEQRKMPGHRQLKLQSLKELSLGCVCRQLNRTCRYLQKLSEQSSTSHALTIAKRTIRPYFVLPTCLRSHVIEETTKMLCHSLPDGTHFLIEPAFLFLLTILLGPDIRQLKVYLCCYYGCSHQTSILKLLATEGIGLKSLELYRPTLLHLDCKLLYAALLNIKNLSTLILRNIANNAILRVIGKACPKLVFLDVACSKEVTNAGLKHLILQVELRDAILKVQEKRRKWYKFPKSLIRKIRNFRRKENQNVLLEYYESKNSLCDTLRVLNVGNTSVTAGGVMFVLQHVPQLESLGEYNCIERVVQMARREEVNCNISFNLTESK